MLVGWGGRERQSDTRNVHPCCVSHQFHTFYFYFFAVQTHLLIVQKVSQFVNGLVEEYTAQTVSHGVTQALYCRTVIKCEVCRDVSIICHSPAEWASIGSKCLLLSLSIFIGCSLRRVTVMAKRKTVMETIKWNRVYCDVKVAFAAKVSVQYD